MLLVAGAGAVVTGATESTSASTRTGGTATFPTLPRPSPEAASEEQPVSPELQSLADSCRDGLLSACDELYFRSPVGSDYETFAAQCGGRLPTSFAGSCASTDSPESSTSSAPTTTAPPTSYGIVDISRVSSDSRADDVAMTLDTYFAGINSGDIPSAVSVFDPAGILDPSDSAQVADFAEGVSSTTDSDIQLRAISAAPEGNGALLADVTFTSRQDAADGPDALTCADWTLAYTLTVGSGGYLIFAASGSYSAC